MRRPRAHRPARSASLRVTPLPSLTDALSRRAALFGAVAASGALVGSTARALDAPVAPLPAPRDADLHRLADLMARADRVGQSIESALCKVPGAGCSDCPEWHAALDAFNGAAVLMRKTPADSHEGLMVKARAMSLAWIATDPETAADLGASLAADVLRLAGGVA